MESIARECEDLDRGNTCKRDGDGLGFTCYTTCDTDLCNEGILKPEEPDMLDLDQGYDPNYRENYGNQWETNPPPPGSQRYPSHGGTAISQDRYNQFFPRNKTSTNNNSKNNGVLSDEPSLIADERDDTRETSTKEANNGEKSEKGAKGRNGKGNLQKGHRKNGKNGERGPVQNSQGSNSSQTIAASSAAILILLLTSVHFK